MHSSTTFRRTAIALSIAALLPAAAHASQQQAAADSILMNHIAGQARQRATAVSAGTPAANAASVTQYREALADIQRGDWGSAATQLTAALARARDNPLYRGELGYVNARMGRLEEAATEYVRAYQAQPRNAWYLAGLAAVRAGQRQFADAAGTIQLAAHGDSAVVDSLIAPAAASWFESAGDRGGALTWSRMAVQKNPNDAVSWLRVAVGLAARRDTSAESRESLDRYFAAAGSRADPVAYAMRAEQQMTRGKTDSAIATMRAATATDTNYNRYLAGYYLQAAREVTRLANPDSAMKLVDLGRPLADTSLRAAFSNFTGRLQLVKLQTLLADVEESRSCETARAADSLASLTERNLQQGASFDSTRTAMILTAVLPGFKQNAQNAVSSCRPAGAAPARRPPARRPTPAPAPARRP